LINKRNAQGLLSADGKDEERADGPMNCREELKTYGACGGRVTPCLPLTHSHTSFMEKGGNEMSSKVMIFGTAS
jgi:hypothetical protein